MSNRSDEPVSNRWCFSERANLSSSPPHVPCPCTCTAVQPELGFVQALRPCTETSHCGKDFVCLRTDKAKMGLSDLTGGMVKMLKSMGVYTDQQNADSCGGVRSGMSRLWNYVGKPVPCSCVHRCTYEQTCCRLVLSLLDRHEDARAHGIVLPGHCVVRWRSKQ